MSTTTRSSAYSYHSIFGDVCSRRFQLLGKSLFITTYLLTFTIGFFSRLSWWSLILPFRALVIGTSFFLLVCLRKNNLHVNFLGYKTLSNQVIGQLLNRKFAYSFIFYWVSSLLFFFTLHSQFENLSVKAVPKKHQYPPLNDKFVFYYYSTLFLAVVYSTQHSIFDRDRLSFNYGSFHTHPRKTILKEVPKIISNSILMSITSATLGPFIYLFVRYVLYDIVFAFFGLFLTLNQSYPALDISFGFLIKVSVISFILLLSWETLNVAFDAYLSVGCLYRGHTISELSSDRLGTLLTGLKSEKQFTKMTAFQELAFIAKSENKAGRKSVYDRNTKRDYIWGDILLECQKVVSENNAHVIATLASTKATQHTTISEPSHKNDAIFGREYYVERGLYEDGLYSKSAVQEPQSFFDSNIITLIISHLTSAIVILKEYYHRFLISGFGIPFRYTLRRESERLCPVPTTVGNAIIAISLFATHAYDEDTKGVVSSTVAEILEILEESVSTCGRFVQNPPAHLVERDVENIISLLHELSMNAFFEVTLKYSPILKDIVLPLDVQRLADWSLEQAYKEDLLD